MIGVFGAESHLGYGQGAAQERLRLRKTVGRLQKLGKVVEIARIVGMVHAKRLFGDRQGASHQRLSFGKMIGVLKQRRQVIESNGDILVMRAQSRPR